MSKDDFNDKRRVSRSNSILGDSFKMGASMLGLSTSSKNIRHLTLDNVYPIDKQEFQQRQQCSICFVSFSKLARRHHCRVCGKTCCADCSSSTINKDRACDICIYRYQQPQKAIIKEALTERLKINAMEYLGGKNQLDEQYKNLQIEMPNPQQLQEERNQTRLRIQKLQSQLEQKRRIREKLQKDLEDYLKQ